MALGCCARRPASDNDGSEMLSRQQRRAIDAVAPGRANDINGTSDAARQPVPERHPRLTPKEMHRTVTASTAWTQIAEATSHAEERAHQDYRE